MGIYSTDFNLNGAFSFSEDAVKGFFDIVARFAKQDIRCTFDFEGGDDLRTSDVDEGLHDLLTKTRQIRGIHFQGYRKGGNSQYVSLSLRDDSFLPSIDCTIQGERSECVATRSEIESLANSARVWYSWFLTSDDRRGNVNLGVLMFAVVISVFAANILLGGDTSSISGFVSLFAEVIAALVVLRAVRRWVFPSVIFAFGFSDHKRRRAEFFQRSILAGIGISLVAGLAVSFLTKKFGW